MRCFADSKPKVERAKSVGSLSQKPAAGPKLESKQTKVETKDGSTYMAAGIGGGRRATTKDISTLPPDNATRAEELNRFLAEFAPEYPKKVLTLITEYAERECLCFPSDEARILLIHPMALLCAWRVRRGRRQVCPFGAHGRARQLHGRAARRSHRLRTVRRQPRRRGECVRAGVCGCPCTRALHDRVVLFGRQFINPETGEVSEDRLLEERSSHVLCLAPLPQNRLATVNIRTILVRTRDLDLAARQRVISLIALQIWDLSTRKVVGQFDDEADVRCLLPLRFLRLTFCNRRASCVARLRCATGGWPLQAA